VLAAALPGVPSHAQYDSYEANPGLISIGGWVVFFASEGPLSYATLTARDLPRDAVRMGPVRGRACQYGLSTPIIGLNQVPRLSGAVGEGGFEKALQQIREQHPDLRGVYDVKVDDHVTTVLTVFHRQCTEVTARGFR
jgi:hypothetical protein